MQLNWYLKSFYLKSKKCVNINESSIQIKKLEINKLLNEHKESRNKEVTKVRVKFMKLKSGENIKNNKKLAP